MVVNAVSYNYVRLKEIQDFPRNLKSRLLCSRNHQIKKPQTSFIFRSNQEIIKPYLGGPITEERNGCERNHKAITISGTVGIKATVFLRSPDF